MYITEMISELKYIRKSYTDLLITVYDTKMGFLDNLAPFEIYWKENPELDLYGGNDKCECRIDGIIKQLENIVELYGNKIVKVWDTKEGNNKKLLRIDVRTRKDFDCITKYYNVVILYTTFKEYQIY